MSRKLILVFECICVRSGEMASSTSSMWETVAREEQLDILFSCVFIMAPRILPIS
jgi:hypothetical protein